MPGFDGWWFRRSSMREIDRSGPLCRPGRLDTPSCRPPGVCQRPDSGLETDRHARSEPLAQPQPRARTRTRTRTRANAPTNSLRTDGSGRANDDHRDRQRSPIAFLGCETVRVDGEFDDVILSVLWWEPDGLVATMAEPIGGVDSERTIVASDTFGEFAYGPIVSRVDGYEPGTPVVPGGGDVSVDNPAVESCIEQVRDGVDEVELEEPFPE